jgi:2-oxoglutarate ferredoxin oxidoreductase subunit beta
MHEMMEAALQHDGFSVVECLSECVQFNRGSYDAAIPRKGGAFPLIPDDHDFTDEEAAYSLTKEKFPGYFGIYFKCERPTLNETEAQIADQIDVPMNKEESRVKLSAALEKLV